jgi:hypothetical protein
MDQVNGYYYGLLLFFGVIFYIVGTQPNVAKFIFLLQKYIEIQYRKTKWWVFNNPKNPVVKYFIWRRSIKLADNIRKQLEESNK